VALQTVIAKFGYKIDLRSKDDISKSLNSLLSEVVGKKEQNLVDTLTIRTMSKAKYSTDNIGHYGLAFDYYSHFTSPIRRYLTLWYTVCYNIILMVGNQQMKKSMKLNVYILLQWKVSD
jgi:exoribonuclease R